MKKFLIYVALLALTTTYIPSLVSATQSNKVTLQSKTLLSKKVVHIAASATSQATAALTLQLKPLYSPDIAPEHVKLMTEAGINPVDFDYVNYIVSRESGWCENKWEGEIGYCPQQVVAVYRWDYPYKGYGLVQSTPANKMSEAGYDWQTNPVTQLRWANAYAKSRYGGWHDAYVHWANPAHHNW